MLNVHALFHGSMRRKPVEPPPLSQNPALESSKAASPATKTEAKNHPGAPRRAVPKGSIRQAS